MNPSGWNPPHTDNTDTLYLGDQHCLVRNSAGFCFYLFFHLRLSVNSWSILTAQSYLKALDSEGGRFSVQAYHVQNHLVAPTSTQTFILPRSIRWVPKISGKLVVKSKLLPRNGSNHSGCSAGCEDTPKIGYSNQIWGEFDIFE